MRNSAFGIFAKTFVATFILLSCVAYATYKIWGNIDRANDVKNQIEDRYSYVPSQNEGISFLLSVDNNGVGHGIYTLIKADPPKKEITLCVLPWQLMGHSGTKYRTLDGFSKEQSGRDIMKAVNNALGLNLTKYIYVDSNTLANCVDLLGGAKVEINSDVEYETENAYVSVFAGKGLISGQALMGVLENPDNFKKNKDGTEFIANILKNSILSYESERIKEVAQNLYTKLLQNADTNLSAEDYLMRKEALFYLIDNGAQINVISADGNFDITKDNFTPTSEFISKLQAEFN